MIGRACLAIGLLAALPGATLAAVQDATAQADAAPPPAPPARLHPSNGPPPRVLPPPPPPVSSDVSGLGLRVFRIPPRPEYPVAALRSDLSGRCIITFTVGADGAPQDIVPDCTDPVFTTPAREAIAAARVNMDADIKPGAVLRLPLRFQTADWDTPQE